MSLAFSINGDDNTQKTWVLLAYHARFFIGELILLPNLIIDIVHEIVIYVYRNTELLFLKRV